MNRVDSLVRGERRLTLEVVTHLIEVERRRLYLPFGYQSLLSYCVRRLGYSESAALRRIRVARLIREHPEVYEKVEKGELTLSTVAKLNGVLSADNKTELLFAVAGKPQREVSAVVAGFRPERAQPDRVKAVGVWARTLAEGVKQSYRRSDGKKLTTADGEEVDVCYRVEFTASAEFMKQVEKLKGFLWHRYPYGMNFETLFGLVMDEYAERHDPDKREERRRQRAERRAIRSAESAATQKTKNRSRHIPASVRDRVHERDKGQCTYVGKNGTRCRATSGIQIDHIEPFGRGGGNHANNLRLLCVHHNRLEAERAYGEEYIRRFTLAKRRSPDSPKRTTHM